MTFRSGPLRAAAALAATFVLVRVVYRVLFHGTDGSGAVVLDLPEVRLPAPFAHVVMFGPVTTGGLWDAAASALPIALTILAFGLVNAVVDLHRVLTRASRRGPLRGIARALAIAGATLPSLADGARAVRFAQRLRGERGGARTLLPLLERTLERAGNVAAALELRGFAGRALSGDCLTPVEARDVEIGFGDAPEGGDRAAGSERAPARRSAVTEGASARRSVRTERASARRSVSVPALALAPGTVTLVVGATGSGKSTLLRAIAGLHSHADGGWIAGSLRVVGHERTSVPPRDLAQRVGVVLQHPREAFATERVRDEIGLALELRGVAPVIVAARVAEVAERVGVAALLDRPTRALSAGEATLVAIAAAIVEHPILLLVDEPLADLDARARSRITGLLDALAHEAGMCVVAAEHRVDVLSAIADVVLRIDDPDGTAGEPAPERVPAERAERSDEPVLRARSLTVTHRHTVAVADADVDLLGGEIVVLTGPNGAGKSSLLAALALPERGARVEATGRVVLVPDVSDDLFVADTVAADCARADRRARRLGRRSSTHACFAGFLGLDPDGPELAARLAQHPRDLSAGERRCLALAIQLAGAPAVLMVDEPTRGLDPEARELVWAALTTVAAGGTAVLVASHEPDIASRADRVLAMHAGVLAAGEVVQPAVVAPLHRVTARSEHPRLGEPPASEPIESGSRHAASARRSLPHLPLMALAAANVVALGAFCWPLVATAVPEQAYAAVPVAALALVPLAALVVVATLDGAVRSAHMLALLGTLAAIGAAARIASTGVGGVEAVFILLILAGRAFGARFGMLLGMATIALSTIITGTFGPWTPFQMFACAWVGAGAGLLPRVARRSTEIAMLCGYGVLASYAFGLLMNLWFWPFAVGYATDISYDGGAPLTVNLSSFLLYSLITSTLSWDTLRAITSVVGLIVVGRPILAALRRAKPLQYARAGAVGTVTPRSTSPRGGGKRTRRSTVRGAAAAPR